MTTPTPAQQLEEDKDTLRFILSGYPKGRYTLERRAINRALAALEAVEGAQLGFMDIESGRVSVVERHDPTPLAGFRDVLIIPADAVEVSRGE